MAACCYFGVDLGNALDHYSPSPLTNGTPHSSFDLLYFTLLLPFTWTTYSKSNSFSPFRFFGKLFYVNFLFPLLFGQKFSKSNFNFAKIFYLLFFCDIEKFPFFANPFHILAAGVLTVSTNASSGIGAC